MSEEGFQGVEGVGGGGVIFVYSIVVAEVSIVITFIAPVTTRGSVDRGGGGETILPYPMPLLRLSFEEPPPPTPNYD